MSRREAYRSSKGFTVKQTPTTHFRSKGESESFLPWFRHLLVSSQSARPPFRGDDRRRRCSFFCCSKADPDTSHIRRETHGLQAASPSLIRLATFLPVAPLSSRSLWERCDPLCLYPTPPARSVHVLVRFAPSCPLWSLLYSFRRLASISFPWLLSRRASSVCTKGYHALWGEAGAGPPNKHCAGRRIRGRRGASPSRAQHFYFTCQRYRCLPPSDTSRLGATAR